jgi:NAD(P)H-quinone oxidoreductase subunit N
MPLLLSGRGFRQELERAGALALFAPLEGGAETRLLRRLRAHGYRAQICSARGLGDPEAFLLQLHGVRPPHLGHQSVGRGAAVGEVQRVMPQLGALLEGDAPIVLWLLEGQVLSSAERASLVNLSLREPRLNPVVGLSASSRPPTLLPDDGPCQRGGSPGGGAVGEVDRRRFQPGSGGY